MMSKFAIKSHYEWEHKVTEEGVYYFATLPDEVIDLLETCRAQGTRIYLDQGNMDTGRSYSVHHDNLGSLRLYESDDGAQVASLYAAEDSLFGGQVPGELVAIMDEAGNDLWRHPQYKPKYAWQKAKLTRPDPYSDYNVAVEAINLETCQPVRVRQFMQLEDAEAWLTTRQRFEKAPVRRPSDEPTP